MLTQRERKDRACGRASNAGQGGNFIKGLREGAAMQRRHLLSGFMQHQFSGPWFGGLSGVVYALMGCAWLRGERDPQSGIFLPRGLMMFSLIWLVAGWFNVFGMSIANGAHITGLVIGLAMAFVDTQNVRKRA